MHAPLSKAYQVEWRSLTGLVPHADDIQALAARAIEPNVFYEPAFMLAAAPVFGADAGAILVRSATGRLAGLFPARIGRPQGGPWAMHIGWTYPFAPLGVPLVDRDDAEGAITAWLDCLANDTERPALLLLPYLPDKGAFVAALNVVLAQNRLPSAAFDPHERALAEPGIDPARYLERAVSAGRRKELRRQRRRLEEFAPLSFAQALSPDDIGAALKDFLVLEASGWKGVAGTAIVNDPAVRAFVENAVTGLAAEGHARIDRMLLDGRAVAATVTLQSGSTAWCWKIAYSEGVARFSPGVQLICELTERLMAVPGIARVDSCAAADHPMIDHIWGERLALSDRLIALRPSMMPFALACQMERLRRGAIAAAKQIRGRLRGR